MAADPLDAGHVVKGVGGVAVGCLSAGLQHEEPCHVAQGLQLGQQHLVGWTRPVPLVSAGVAISRAADQVERGGMPCEQIDHARTGHVDCRRHGER